MAPPSTYDPPRFTREQLARLIAVTLRPEERDWKWLADFMKGKTFWPTGAEERLVTLYENRSAWEGRSK